MEEVAEEEEVTVEDAERRVSLVDTRRHQPNNTHPLEDAIREVINRSGGQQSGQIPGGGYLLFLRDLLHLSFLHVHVHPPGLGTGTAVEKWVAAIGRVAVGRVG